MFNLVNPKKTSIILTFLSYFLVLLLFFPALWLIISAFVPTSELFSKTILPTKFTFENFRVIFFKTGIPQNILNSAIITVGSTFLTVIVSALGAYSISRFEYPGKKAVARGVLFSYMFPKILLLIPLFVLLTRFGMLDTYLGLILVYLTFNIPFSTWLLKSYFDTIPKDLEEAAMVDGASRMQAFIKVIAPLAAPGIAAAAVFAFIYSWNEYLYALVFINSASLKTLPVAIASYVGRNRILWGRLLAASTIAAFPALLFTFVAQKYLVAGLTAGAVKE